MVDDSRAGERHIAADIRSSRMSRQLGGCRIAVQYAGAEGLTLTGEHYDIMADAPPGRASMQ